MSFNAQAFMNQTFDSAPSKESLVIPADEPLLAQITKAEADVTKDNSPLLRITWKIDPQMYPALTEVAVTAGLEDLVVNQTIWLNLSPDGALLMGAGANQGLAFLLEAVGLANQPWSIATLVGLTARLTISHRPDKDNPEVIYNDVKRVSAP